MGNPETLSLTCSRGGSKLPLDPGERIRVDDHPLASVLSSLQRVFVWMHRDVNLGTLIRLQRGDAAEVLPGPNLNVVEPL